MIRFLLGFGVGVAAILGALIAEEWLRDASLRAEGLPLSLVDEPFAMPMTWVAGG